MVFHLIETALLSYMFFGYLHLNNELLVNGLFLGTFLISFFLKSFSLIYTGLTKKISNIILVTTRTILMLFFTYFYLTSNFDLVMLFEETKFDFLTLTLNPNLLEIVKYLIGYGFYLQISVLIIVCFSYLFKNKLRSIVKTAILTMFVYYVFLASLSIYSFGDNLNLLVCSIGLIVYLATVVENFCTKKRLKLSRFATFFRFLACTQALFQLIFDYSFVQSGNLFGIINFMTNPVIHIQNYMTIN